MEYVFMEAVADALERNEKVTSTYLYVRTGLIPQEQNMCLESMIMKGYIFPEARSDGKPAVSPKYYDFFKDFEVKFKEFWTKDGKVCWPGSKVKALKLYKDLLKKYPHNLLMHRRNAYFKYLHYCELNGFDRQKMMATVFIGPQERFKEDWSKYADQEQEKYAEKQKIQKKKFPEAAEIKPSVETQEKRMKKYEDTGSPGESV